MNLTDRRGRNVFYNSAAWRKLRDWKLRQNPLCEECLKHELLVPAVHVDHLTPLAKDPQRALDEENLQSLCRSCHTSKTNEERTSRKGKHWSSKRVGVDGLPLSPDHPWNRESGDDGAKS